MAKFKSGDRVVMVSYRDELSKVIPIGAIGTVIEDNSTVPYVKWGENHRHIEGDDHVFACYQQELEFAESQNISESQLRREW